MKYSWGKRTWHQQSSAEPTALQVRTGRRAFKDTGRKALTMKCGVTIAADAPTSANPAGEKLKGPICAACTGAAKAPAAKT